MDNLFNMLEQTALTLSVAGALFAIWTKLRKSIFKYFNVKYETSKKRLDAIERRQLRHQLWMIYSGGDPSEADIARGIIDYERQTYAEYSQLGGNHEIDAIREDWYKKQIKK